MQRSLFLLFSLLALSLTALGQGSPSASDRDQSNIEKISARSGTLIEREFIAIGNVQGIAVETLLLTDVIAKSKVSGVRLSFTRGSDQKAAVLDSDELGGLITSLTFLREKIFTSTRVNYTEVKFMSRGGFQAGAYFNVKDEKWTPYLRLSQYDSNSSYFLKPDDFGTLLELLAKAKEQL